MNPVDVTPDGRLPDADKGEAVRTLALARPPLGRVRLRLCFSGMPSPECLARQRNAQPA